MNVAPDDQPFEEDTVSSDNLDDPIPSDAFGRGPYDPTEFDHLHVSSDVKDLFQFIAAYDGHVNETTFYLQPFLLDYIPAVGEPDAFLKVSRPDNVEDELGLIVLDEPAALQSDPVVLDMQLRTLSKNAASSKSTVVMKKVTRADKNPVEIENWIKSIGELHKSKPATVIHYSKLMPDLETLMQEWPQSFELLLNQVDVLGAADCSAAGATLEQYSDLICALLDIPVHKSRIESLHVLFSLYMQFKNSPHFKMLTLGKLNDDADKSRESKPDTLIL